VFFVVAVVVVFVLAVFGALVGTIGNFLNYTFPLAIPPL
jgi:hypothetical protein